MADDKFEKIKYGVDKVDFYFKMLATGALVSFGLMKFYNFCVAPIVQAFL